MRRLGTTGEKKETESIAKKSFLSDSKWQTGNWSAAFDFLRPQALNKQRCRKKSLHQGVGNLQEKSASNASNFRKCY
jgi:hypothetical protein